MRAPALSQAVLALLKRSTSRDSGLSERGQSSIQEKNMEDMPIWFKITVWGTVGATALYTVWGIAQMLIQP
jgi:hypothetical protein